MTQNEIETVADPTSHGPMFFLSLTRGMYMRAKWISTNSDEKKVNCVNLLVL